MCLFTNELLACVRWAASCGLLTAGSAAAATALFVAVAAVAVVGLLVLSSGECDEIQSLLDQLLVMCCFGNRHFTYRFMQ